VRPAGRLDDAADEIGPKLSPGRTKRGSRLRHQFPAHQTAGGKAEAIRLRLSPLAQFEDRHESGLTLPGDAVAPTSTAADRSGPREVPAHRDIVLGPIVERAVSPP
jgi:hypothetical protein